MAKTDTSGGLSAEEREAVKQRAKELREQEKAGKNRAAGEKAALEAIAEMEPDDRALAEGLHKVFLEAGFEWREAGCSMCLAMNPDKLEPGERCASTSNRNFEGRQGKGGRTHLVSPAMAAAAACAGHFVDVRRWKYQS